MKKAVLLTSAVLFLHGCSATFSNQNGQQQLPPPQINPTPRYLEQFSGRGENENGQPFSFHTYLGPNGHKVSRRFEAYDNSNAAELRFGQIVKSSDEMISESPLADANGSRVGKRAILKSHLSVSSVVKFKLVLSKGSKIHIIESDSLENLQEFEMEFLPSVFAAD